MPETRADAETGTVAEGVSRIDLFEFAPDTMSFFTIPKMA